VVYFVESRFGIGNLRATCEKCGTIMHRRAKRGAITEIMPGVSVQIVQAEQRPIW
jgi:hypothetical protein